MPDIQFTPAQQAAVSARGGSLLVSAAAGSGKTRVLVERVVGLITDPDHPVDADQLLIVTFTNAAAAKLRGDIAARLGEEVRAHPENARLRRQQMLLQRASIGTVDAFCLHFVQQNFAVLDIPPDFETAEEADLVRIEQETLAEVLETAYQDADFRAYADLFDRGRSDATAGETVLELYRFVRALPHPDKALRQFAESWQTDAAPQDTPWGRKLLKMAYQRAKDARRILLTAATLATRDDETQTAYSGVLQDDADRAGRICKRLETGDWDAIAAELDDTAGANRKAGRIKGGKDSNPTALAVSELRDRAKKQLAALRTDCILCTALQWQQDRATAAPLVAALVRVTQLFSEKCFAAKCAEKKLDYADFEHLTLDLLVDAENRRTALCRVVSGRYAAVLVDEYQDTNALQDAIYFALAHTNADNLFFVGDIKQSIYRFRQAAPEVFIEKQQVWLPYPQPAPLASSLSLDRNFRSAPGVIDGINYFFSVLFSEQVGGVEYGDGQRLVVGLPNPDYPGFCEMDVTLGTVEQDAEQIARRIAEMVDTGFAVRCKQGTRPCTYEDFCILLRGRKDFTAYEAALRKHGIPVFADTSSDILDTPAIRPFAALLQVLDNPAQDIPLASVLLSPMFPYTPDDLVALRARCPKGSLYAAVLYSGGERFAPFAEALQEYRRLARTLPMDRLLEELLARTGYLAAVGTLPEGPRCREDLLAFTGWAAGAGRGGLSALCRAMESAKRGKGLVLSPAGQTRPGCVSIMTVHRSKGLEFPVVFVANTTHKFNQSDAVRPVLSHSTLGVGVMLRAGHTAKRYKTLPYAALTQAIRAETVSEEMRILYVALTRAQDALIITAPIAAASGTKLPALCAQTEAATPEMLQSMSSWGAWLMTAALLHPDSHALWDITGMLPHTLPTRVPLTIRVYTGQDAETEPPQAEPAAPDAEFARVLRQNFAWRSPRAALETIPAKVSVSAVTHAAKPVALERPAFMQKSGLTGAERGTAIHAFMQSVPFDSPAPDLAAEVQRQIDAELLDKNLSEKLRLSDVQPFFASAVWRRIRQAAQILREEPFITALPADEVVPGSGVPGAEVLVQGIADLVLVFDDHAEILDYKTDRSTDAEFYLREYDDQLRLYRRAFAQRLRVPVTKLTIYSFTMQQEIDVPLR